MRTTLDIPSDLLKETQREIGLKSKTETIVFALRELLRRRRIEHLKELVGKVELDIDVPSSRRRRK